MGKSLAFVAMAAALTLAGSGARADDGLEPVKDLLASQARDQGFACNQPKAAHMDADLSKPNAKVWILECEQATFRMIVVPDMAAKIEKVAE